MATPLFITELNEFRDKTGIDIKTVCSHGGVPYNGGRKIGYERNLDIFGYHPSLYKEAGITGEAYLDIDFSNVTYFSDSHSEWNGCRNIWEIIQHIESHPVKIVYLLVHPDPWSNSVIEFLFDKAKKVGCPLLEKAGILRAL